MTPCDSCEKEVATNSKVCPHCGHERTTIAGWLALFFGVVCFFATMGFLENGLAEKGAGLVMLGSGWVCYKALMRWRKFI